VIIKQGDYNWLPQYFIGPGVECYQNLHENIQEMSKSEDILTFANKYLNGNLIPNHLRNENITASLENNKKERDFFTNELTVVKKINAAQLERLAMDPQAHGFIVIACEFDNEQCQYGNEALNNIV
jgi:hypothetical protein